MSDPSAHRGSAAPLVFALACLAVAGGRLAVGRTTAAPVLLLAKDAPPEVAPPAGLEPEFVRTMTPDDVARGVWALARGQGPGLTEDQRVALLPAAREARAARFTLDGVTAARRAARDTLRASGSALAAALVDAGWSP